MRLSSFSDVHFSERYILVSALEEIVSTLLSERGRMFFSCFLCGTISIASLPASGKGHNIGGLFGETGTFSQKSDF